MKECILSTACHATVLDQYTLMILEDPRKEGDIEVLGKP